MKDEESVLSNSIDMMPLNAVNEANFLHQWHDLFIINLTKDTLILICLTCIHVYVELTIETCTFMKTVLSISKTFS